MPPRMPQLPGSIDEVLAWFTRARHWLSFADDQLARLPNALVVKADWNPGNVAFGASASTTVRVPGARMGNPVSVGFSDEEAGVLFTGQVQEPDVVRVVLSNLSVAGSAFDMNAGKLTVIVWRPV
jgi:hypothetical protein